MARQSTIEFGNFICKFGDLNLLDFVEEIVIPAFTNPVFKRKFADDLYFFLNTSLVNLADTEPPVLAIIGRHVKSMLIHQEQTYTEAEGLKPSTQTFEMAPSSVFVLILNTHKLLLFDETRNAPGLEAFGTTAHRCMVQAWEALIDRVHGERREEAGPGATE